MYYHVLTSLKLPSVALYVVECTFQGGFDSFRAHQLFYSLQGNIVRAVPHVSVPCPHPEEPPPGRNKLIRQGQFWKLIATLG